MVERAANADGDVHRGGDGAATDAHLKLLRQPPLVNHVSGSGHRCAEGAGRFHHAGHAFLADTHANPDHNASAGQVQALGILLELFADQANVRPIERYRCQALHGDAGARLGNRRREQSGSQGDQVGQGLGEDWRNHVAAEGRFQLDQLSLVVNFQVDGVAGQAQAELGRETGGQVSLYTHLRIRDEQPILYGFLTPTALGLFLMLTAVSGVGPRLSLALLSNLDADGLQQAIAAEDVSALSSTPGVGRRTAGRIILELKGKLADTIAEAAPMPASADSEVVEALMALGYSASEARQAVTGIRGAADLSVEERIRLALQQFTPGR